MFRSQLIIFAAVASVATGALGGPLGCGAKVAPRPQTAQAAVDLTVAAIVQNRPDLLGPLLPQAARGAPADRQQAIADTLTELRQRGIDAGLEWTKVDVEAWRTQKLPPPSKSTPETGQSTASWVEVEARLVSGTTRGMLAMVLRREAGGLTLHAPPSLIFIGEAERLLGHLVGTYEQMLRLLETRAKDGVEPTVAALESFAAEVSSDTATWRRALTQLSQEEADADGAEDVQRALGLLIERIRGVATRREALKAAHPALMADPRVRALLEATQPLQ